MFKIITDTNSGLTVKDAEGLGLVFVPQITIIGGKSYREGYELSFEQLAEMMPKLPELPTTAAFPVGEYIKIFEKLAAEKTPALLISESAGVSGTFVAASTALKEVPQADIHIVDTRTIGPGLGTLVRLAVKWEKEGLSRDEVEKRVGEMAKREKIFFLVATLENLKRGGRIGGAKALLGSVLQVKPILTIVERLKELAIQFYRNGAEHINIAHSTTEEEVQQVKADLEKALGISNIPTMNVPPAILIHVGAGAIAVSAFKKP
jgi:DegV family protein with EDD domain